VLVSEIERGIELADARACPMDCRTSVAALAWCSGAAGADLGAPVAASCPEAPEARYFPVGAFHPPPDSRWDLFVRQWYSSYLAAMKEPPLSCGAQEITEAYRFLRLPSFFADPVAVRIVRRGDDYSLEATVLDGRGAERPGRVSERVTKKLSREQWQVAMAELKDMQFWRMPTRDPHLPGTDGTRWIVEGRRDGRYHVVDRWEGTDGIGALGTGTVFLDLAFWTKWSPPAKK
jgi:hypothetical protein